MKIECMTNHGLIRLLLDETTLQYTVDAEGVLWQSDAQVPPTYTDAAGQHLFAELTAEFSPVQNSVGCGLCSVYSKGQEPLF